MKKFLIALVILFIALLISGCSLKKSESSDSKKELTLLNNLNNKYNSLLDENGILTYNYNKVNSELKECWEFNEKYCAYEIDNVPSPRSEIISRIKPSATSFEVIYNRQIYLINKDSKYYWLECGSESMIPTFNCNSTIIVYKPEKDEIFIGDIIGFRTPEYSSSDFVIHRIVGKEGDKYITKGDSNEYLDDYKVKFKNVEYKIIGMVY